MKKFIVFAHSHCTDGLVAASIINYALRLNHLVEPEIVFVKYGQEQKALDSVSINKDTTVYCVDFAFNRELTLNLCKFADKVIVIDHHKTALENLEGLVSSAYNFYMHYNVEKSGASLVYDYCISYLGLNKHIKLSQQNHIRIIVEMVQDRDLWLFRLFMTREFSEYVFAYVQPNDINRMTEILFKYNKHQLDKLCQLGSTIMEYKDSLIAKKLESYVFAYITINNTKLLLINETQEDLVSSLGNALCIKYDMPVCLYKLFSKPNSAKTYVSLSFRSMDHLEPVDEVARLFSGGGHRNAAGGICDIDRFTDLLSYN